MLFPEYNKYNTLLTNFSHLFPFYFLLLFQKKAQKKITQMTPFFSSKQCKQPGNDLGLGWFWMFFGGRQPAKSLIESLNSLSVMVVGVIGSSFSISFSFFFWVIISIGTMTKTNKIGHSNGGRVFSMSSAVTPKITSPKKKPEKVTAPIASDKRDEKSLPSTSSTLPPVPPKPSTFLE